MWLVNYEINFDVVNVCFLYVFYPKFIEYFESILNLVKDTYDVYICIEIVYKLFERGSHGLFPVICPNAFSNLRCCPVMVFAGRHFVPTFVCHVTDHLLLRPVIVSTTQIPFTFLYIYTHLTTPFLHTLNHFTIPLSKTFLFFNQRYFSFFCFAFSHPSPKNGQRRSWA